MKLIVAVILISCCALAVEEDSKRKSRQIFNSLVHQHGDPVSDYIQTVQIVDPTTVQTVDLVHPAAVVPHLLPATVQSTAVPLSAEPVGYSPRPFHVQAYRGSTYDPTIANALTLLSATARARVPQEHPVREETNDYHLPTPLYGLYPRSGSHGYQSPQGYGYLNPYGTSSYYHQYGPSGIPYRDLGSTGPYSFPPTSGTTATSYHVPAEYYQPSLGNYGSIQYGSEVDYFYGSSGRRGLHTQAILHDHYSRTRGNTYQNRGRQPSAIFRHSGESYLSDDGTRSSPSGPISQVGTQGAPVLQGSYSYTAPDGRPITAQYYADANGFRVEGTHVPTGQGSLGSQDSESSQEPQEQESQELTTESSHHVSQQHRRNSSSRRR